MYASTFSPKYMEYHQVLERHDQKSTTNPPTMRENGLNPVQQERKKEKERQLKKAKAEKLERLSKIDAGSLERRIQRLEQQQQENNGTLAPHQQRQLERLKTELEDVKRAKSKKGVEESSDPTNTTPSERRPYNPYFGKKSIYYDPVLNPRGDPPEGYPFAERPFDDDADDDSGYETSESVSSIPMPRMGPKQEAEVGIRHPKPRTEARTVYESAPVLRDLTKESTSTFVPAALLRKRRKVDPTVDAGPNVEPQPDDERPQPRVGQVLMEEVEDEDDW